MNAFKIQQSFTKVHEYDNYCTIWTWKESKFMISNHLHKNLLLRVLFTSHLLK